MKDHLRVTGFINECPCLEFIGRLNGVDMVGEKLSPEIAVNIINDFSQYESVSPISLLAIPSSDVLTEDVSPEQSRPRYVLLCDGKCKAEQRADLSRQLEDSLCESFHYKLARDLGQLGEAQVLLMSNAMDIYTSHKIDRGMVAGNIKIEPLVLWQGDALPMDCLLYTSPSPRDRG